MSQRSEQKPNIGRQKILQQGVDWNGASLFTALNLIAQTLSLGYTHDLRMMFSTCLQEECMQNNNQCEIQTLDHIDMFSPRYLHLR
jgi:hypothetical protein